MAAIITHIIPVQNFELVRDLIGAIIKVELENQKVLKTLSEDINVYQERTTPFSNAEELAINVLLSSANYSGMTQKDSQGRTMFFIDIYTNGKASPELTGGLDSSKRLHKYIGLIRYILQYSEYKTLSLPPGIIAGGSVDDFAILDPTLQQDSSFTRMGRISVSYRIQEQQQLVQGVAFEEIITQVKLAETDLGYQYQLIN